MLPSVAHHRITDYNIFIQNSTEDSNLSTRANLLLLLIIIIIIMKPVNDVFRSHDCTHLFHDRAT